MTKMHMPPPMPTTDRRNRGAWLRVVAVTVIGVAAYGFACAITGEAPTHPIHQLMRQMHG